MNTTTKDPTWQDILMKAASIVEEGWCQGAMHRNWDGEECYRSGAIESCAEGAIQRASDELSDGAGAAYDLASAADRGLRKHLGKRLVPTIANWNDQHGRTADEVAEAMRQAAKSTRTYTETTNGGRL